MREPASESLAKAFSLPGGRDGCLLLHGFTGSPSHVRVLGERLAQAGYSVLCPLFAGHGTTVDDMIKTSGRQWVADARAAYAQLRQRCDRVAVLGLSMGGALALMLAAEYDVAACVPICAPIIVRNHLAASLTPVARYFLPTRRKWAADHADGREGFDEDHDLGYLEMPVARVPDMLSIARRARAHLYAVTAPLLVVQSTRDESVDPRSASLIEKGASSDDKAILWLQNSPHVCTIGREREQVNETVLAFLERVMRNSAL